MTTRRPLAEAMRRADDVVDMLREGCTRIEIAGSIRRESPDVKDIEVVVVPGHQADLFGGAAFDLLNEVIRKRVREKRLVWRNVQTGLYGAHEPEKLDGRKFYALGTVEQGGDPWPIDVFCVRPPAQWGAIMAIRTGPADYSQRLVTQARQQMLKCEDGRLVSIALMSCGAVRDTPEERDFIEACGLPFLPPTQRR